MSIGGRNGLGQLHTKSIEACDPNRGHPSGQTTSFMCSFYLNLACAHDIVYFEGTIDSIVDSDKSENFRKPHTYVHLSVPP